MSAGGRRSYNDDITIVRVSKSGETTRNNKGGPYFLQIIVVLLFALLFAVVGYLYCVQAGLIYPPDAVCCIGVLDFEFEFSQPES